MLLARVVACGSMTSLITSASGIIYSPSPCSPSCLLPPLTSSPTCNARSLAHKMPAVTSPDNTVKICFSYSFFHFNFAACIKLCASGCVSLCVSVCEWECVLVCVVSLSALLLKFSWVQSQQGGNYQAERSNGQLGATCRLINQLLGLYTASPFLTFLSRTMRVLF